MTFNQIPSWQKKKKELKDKLKEWADSGAADGIIEAANEKRKPEYTIDDLPF